MDIYTPWREQLTEGLTPLQEQHRPPYENAKHVRAYSSWLIPGMLQTRGYVQTIFASIQAERNLTDSDTATAVDSRMARQPLLVSSATEYEFLIEEASLRNGIGGADVMVHQLEHIAYLIESEEVTIGVLPIGFDRARWPEASFWIYDHDRVNIELVSGSVNLTDRDDVAEYETRFGQFAAEAVYDTLAHSLVLAIMESMR